MEVCIVGGIFGKPEAYRELHRHAPETVLAEGLRRRGVLVTTVGHQEFNPNRDAGVQIVHVHHAGIGAVRGGRSLQRGRFVFTPHDGHLLIRGGVRRIRGRIARAVMEHANCVVALSEVEAESFRMWTKSEVSVIPNGIPEEAFPLVKRIRRRDRQYGLLYVGQLVSSKGVDLLFPALKRLREKFDVSMTLVYQNSARERYLHSVAEGLELLGQVKFRGFLGGEELSQAYGDADIVVLPSHAEALPSVITESLLSGTPVVATRVGGVADQVGAFGCVVDPGSVDALVDGIESMLRRLPDLENQRTAMREHARARFSVDTMVEAHLRLYERMLAAPKREAPYSARALLASYVALYRLLR